MKLNPVFRLFTIILILTLTFSVLSPAEKSRKIDVKAWLVNGPVEILEPAFFDDFTTDKVLKHEFIDYLYLMPASGDTVSWAIPPGKQTQWSPVNSGDITLGKFSGKHQVAYAVTYLYAPEFLEAKLSILTEGSFVAYLDGSKICTNKNDSKKIEKKDKDITLKLEPGHHTLILKLVAHPVKKAENWTFKPSINLNKSDNLTISTSPEHFIGMRELLELQSVSSVRISPDGKHLLINYSKRNAPEGDRDRWFEIINTKTKKTIFTYPVNDSISQINWSPDSKLIAFVTRDKDKSSIWTLAMDNFKVRNIKRGLKNFSSYSWLADNEYMLISQNTGEKAPKEGLKRIRSIADRKRGNRSKTYLSILTVDNGVLTPLANDMEGVYYQDVTADGKYLLLSKNFEDYAERPYYRNQLFKMDLKTLNTELLLDDSFSYSGVWSPDGSKLVFRSSAGFGDNLGKSQDKFPYSNDYDGQLYILDIRTKDVVPITKEFDPSVNSYTWSRNDNNIYMNTTDKQRSHLYVYDTKKSEISLVDTPLDMLNGFSIADSSPLIAVYGTNPDYPDRVFLVNMETGKYELIADPSADEMANVKIGKMEEWTFKNKLGYTIDGRIHYPPNFSKDKKWPCIVYYYGGTSPVGMSYGGRYPKNWYASHGYVVYVLQPRGCDGYGQEFSAWHVNDWGAYSVEDIIEGTEKFLGAHPFIDKNRVGCIGASYGGFATEMLISKTDMFAAAISHAGISLLPSYWGGGYWGVDYSAIATANKFPWNGKEIYADRSPLFRADKINTPLLLLHGSVDTNVPPHESHYLYAALKLLGKEVEYIQVLGENHWILQYKNRIKWYKTIIAYFDQWLKGKPGYWEHMYPPERKNN